MHLSLNSLFINISRILWAFDITPVVDANGNEIIPDSWNYTNGFNSRPVSFDCTITARNAKVVECLKMEYESAKMSISGWQW